MSAASNGGKKGDILMCRNGHEICELIEDLNVGDMNWASKFGKWRQPEPTVGGPAPLCAVCGVNVFDMGSIILSPGSKFVRNDD